MARIWVAVLYIPAMTVTVVTHIGLRVSDKVVAVVAPGIE